MSLLLGNLRRLIGDLDSPTDEPAPAAAEPESERATVEIEAAPPQPAR